MPVEVRNRLLESEQVIHSAHYDVDSGGVASLSTQVVLEVQVVSLTQELEEVEQRDGQVVVRQHFTHSWGNHRDSEIKHFQFLVYRGQTLSRRYSLIDILKVCRYVLKVCRYVYLLSICVLCIVSDLLNLS